MSIIKEKDLDIVCRLGGFHMLMSFLGGIEKLMVGSGLEEVFEEIYSEDTVKHIFWKSWQKVHWLAIYWMPSLMEEN